MEAKLFECVSKQKYFFSTENKQCLNQNITIYEKCDCGTLCVCGQNEGIVCASDESRRSVISSTSRITSILVFYLCLIYCNLFIFIFYILHAILIIFFIFSCNSIK